MPVEDVLSRVQELTALATRVADPATAENLAGSFASLLEPAPGTDGPIGAQPDALPWMPGGESLPLDDATDPAAVDGATGLAPVYPVSAVAFATADSSQAGLRTLAVAGGELGVQEEPPGSNDGPRIAQYRTATAGAENAPGPRCAYFVSWAAARAGSPIGDLGEGCGSVAQITDWAQRTGRMVPPGEAPRPGDLILFGTRHVGIVESVGPGDRLTTVEGNHSDRVERVERTVGEATGFVRL